MTTTHTTRFAPSPTGAMHLGNARTFVVNWLLARQNNWPILMRIEDIDGPRIKSGADQQLLDELAWLGLTWNSPVVYQSSRVAEHRMAMEHLVQSGVAYPCTCSRKEISEAASAPHSPVGDAYPNTCRGRFASADAAAQSGKPFAWRVFVDDERIEFVDQFAGPQRFELAKTCGDFVIFKSDGLPAYQLAVVVDDHAAGVDAIVRGDDLLESAARQIYLRRLLGMNEAVKYWHLPLVVGEDGRRLAKRHGDTRLAHYRRAKCTPEKILGLIAFWSGAADRRAEISLADMLNKFDIARMPAENIVFTQADHDFLIGK